MVSQWIRLCLKGKGDLTDAAAKRACASLCSTMSIFLNLLLCAAKIAAGALSRSVAISADGFNNLADAGISLVALLGFRVAQYGRGDAHPFGHGRFEWIMGIFASLSVVLMGGRLFCSSVHSIRHPQAPLFSAAVAAVLALSILVKGWMYFYDRQFARIAGSEALKAAAADSAGDAAATGAVLLSAVAAHLTGWQLDGYCGAVVSGLIAAEGIKSLWSVLGRVMGQAADPGIAADVLRAAAAYPAIAAVRDLMVHDHGFGRFVVSLRAEGYKKDAEALYDAIQEVSCSLYERYRCGCFIQADHLIEDDALTARLRDTAVQALQGYGGRVRIDDLRLIESGAHITAAFDLRYPAGLQKSEETICRTLEQSLMAEDPRCRAVIKGILHRERYSPFGRDRDKDKRAPGGAAEQGGEPA